MTIEIHELIIEARVIVEGAAEADGRRQALAANLVMDDPRLINRLVRQVVEALREQQERV